MLRRIAAVAVMVGFMTGVVAVAPGLAQPKGPADFQLTNEKAPGPVTFSHKSHMEAAEKCNACHTKLFKMKKGGEPLTMAKMNAGEQCGACHNGKTEMKGKVVFSTSDKANCEKCHKKS